MSIGQPVKRLDAEAKVTARARYTEDMLPPGVHSAVYIRGTVAHGRVVSMDTRAALAVPGVEAVFTHADVPKILYATAGHPYSLDPEHADVADTLLLTDHVRFHGDEIGVVVARDELAARRAASLVEVVYEEYPVMTTPEAAMAPEAKAIHPNGNVVQRSEFSVGGDAEAIIAGADVVVEGHYETPITQHCHMEPLVAHAYMEDMERITVVSSTQIPHICRRIVGQALGIPWSRVRIIKPCVGGGFGAKQDVVLEPMVAFLAWKLGRPVRMALTREESMITRTRHAFRMHARMGFSREGRLQAASLDVVSNTGAYASHGHSVAAAGGGKLCSMYPHSAMHFQAATVYTNLPIAGAMRGYGSPQTIFAFECLMEEGARALDIDPLDLRLINAGRPGDVNPLSKRPIETHGLVECLQKGRELFRWDERRAAHKNSSSEVADIRRGVGVACFSFNSGVYPVGVELSGARLTLVQDGCVLLQVGATEIGQGADTVFAQMAASVLDLPMEAMRVVSTQDTDVAPFDPGAFASRQTYVAGPAVKAAAEDLRSRILEHAAEMTGYPAHALDLKAGFVVAVREPSRVFMSLEELALDAYYNKDRGSQLTAERSVKTRTNAPSFGCTFVEVEVDVPLCRVRVTDILNVHDCGVVINPATAKGQVQGGMAMAIGWALYEELLVDPRSGQVRNNNLLDYKMPTFPDLPDLDVAFVQTLEPSGGFGNKSLGEPPLLSPGPAIRNAVWDATGVKVNAIPLTPKALFPLFREAGLLRDY
ncbi:xanthine dehydrogenase molybdenum-binding subunit [Desulfonatronum thiosulfatophilum]|uniref:Xanthine dehydrogenase molybdenum-binding subunit n=1 Tax=Desulfonatronum thiosulfatophilum TaxID=617002 RepID=A0A1G6ALX5_9BACT|nr:xanthine dehydrogenase subunit XdhA [Desulfonatronum thiosulfatophilum]SDB09417.1 xanthine dehydrogenase molybdenum-binding subunit [Desulfonatronum thiosulfatophilum]